ncbi:cilia- and flagella-associated protein 20 [Nephila pilipes]|uniref:Cilia- and flagella-associated protein 20 n=1 Tax=Nephila pilipes TaxID=299642 RepID=A0A8X6TFR8_NEPPI|nr:cilia- and flagella-associated protein 20 [Nephila pilipes]
MFQNCIPDNFMSILYSLEEKPLDMWDVKAEKGHGERVHDNDLKSLTIEIVGNHLCTTYITCPSDPQNTLGIQFLFLFLSIKNLKKPFTFEILVLDDTGTRRRFSYNDNLPDTQIEECMGTRRLILKGGWNIIKLDLADMTRTAFGTTYVETLRVQIHSNLRVRRVYFCDRLYADHELPK